ncbi:GNAT family N-acetyltransferase [Aureimonas sp. SK2]|uniref:GNAT family N-acetyltransferase n=1 Tax=Aureimonas sp. SK2 TaxID=3015992 RepID=UPI002444E21B|nr:GNAT family N-acetyltransferase [Aureimonas sp. SK2]
MVEVSLRAYRSEDVDAVAEIWHAGASLPGVGPPSLPPRSEFTPRVATHLAVLCRIVVAERSRLIVGFVAMTPDEQVLAELFVHTASLGGGIGRRLLDEAKRAMPGGFTLFTRPTNTRACRFYEANGLRLLRTDTHPRFGDPIVFYGWMPS